MIQLTPHLTPLRKKPIMMTQGGFPPVQQNPRFSSANEMSDHDIESLTSFEYCHEPNYLEKVSRLKGGHLKNQVLKTANALRRIERTSEVIQNACDTGPHCIVVGPVGILIRSIAKKQAYNRLCCISDERIRTAFINRLIGNYEKRYNLIGYAAVHTITDVKERDRLIEKACRSEDKAIRRIGASMLPLLSNLETKKQLIKILELDPNLRVSIKAKMAKNPQGLGNKLFGWAFMHQHFATHFGTIEDEDDFAVSGPVQTPVQLARSQKMDVLAQQMAERLKTHFQEDATVRKALIEKYGDEQHLPSAADIKRQFLKASKAHLQKQATVVGRLFGNGTSPDQIEELAFNLMEIADKTEAFLNLGDIAKQLQLLGAMQQQQKEFDAGLEQAKAVVAQLALFRSKTEKEFKQQQDKVKELESLATFPENKPFFERLDTERETLKETEEKKKVFDSAYQMAQSKLDNLKAGIEAQKKKWVQSMQYGMLGLTRDEMQKLVDKNEINLEMLDMQKLIEKAEQKKYEVLAEQGGFVVEEPEAKPTGLTMKQGGEK